MRIYEKELLNKFFELACRIISSFDRQVMAQSSLSSQADRFES